jgi:hypothetical protein
MYNQKAKPPPTPFLLQREKKYAKDRSLDIKLKEEIQRK